MGSNYYYVIVFKHPVALIYSSFTLFFHPQCNSFIISLSSASEADVKNGGTQ